MRNTSQRYGIPLPPPPKPAQPKAEPPKPAPVQSSHMARLICLTSQCSMERNCAPVTALNKDKIKLLSLLGSGSDIYLQLKLQKCGTEVFRCHKKSIIRCHTLNIDKGIIAFEICEDESQIQSYFNPSRSANLKPLTKIMLKEIQVDGIRAMLRILQGQQAVQPVQPEQQSVDPSKKRVLSQISGKHEIQNPRKVVKIQEGSISKQVRKKLSLTSLPWDTVNIIIDFTPKDLYPLWKLNKSISRLLMKRLQALTFSKPDITEHVFFSVLKKYERTISHLQIQAHLKQVKKTQFDKIMVRPTKLISLSLVGFHNIAETALTRLIDHSSSTLSDFKISYRSQGLTTMTCLKLAKCSKLSVVELGQSLDNFDRIPFELIAAVKSFVKRKEAQLTTLRLYECDEEMLIALAKSDSTSLRELQIVKFIQRKEGVVELESLTKFKALAKLNLCSTWFPLNLKMAEDDNGVDVTGSREFEKIIWALRPTLTQINLGNYVWDDLVIYIVEMCKQLEVVSINSQQVTDGSICHLIKRCTQLTALDVSGVTKFCGLALQEVDQTTFAATKLKWFQVNLEGHEMQMCKERLAQLAPSCQVLLNVRRYFSII